LGHSQARNTELYEVPANVHFSLMPKVLNVLIIVQFQTSTLQKQHFIQKAQTGYVGKISFLPDYTSRKLRQTTSKNLCNEEICLIQRRK